MYVIAGVTGHVGGVAASALLDAKKPVKVLVRDAAKGKAWSSRGAEVAVGDLGDANFVAGALKGATAFFTLLPPDYAATDFYAYQRKTADAIAAGVKQSGVPHVVLLSSVGADLPDGTGPIKGLHYLENALRATGTKLTAIRAGLFQENVGQSLAPAKNQGIYPNFLPSQDIPIPQIATRDIGALVARSMLSPPTKSDVVTLQGPAYTAKQVAEKLGAAVGKQLQIVDIPQAGWLGALTGAGLPLSIAEAFVEMYGAFAAGKIVPKGDRSEQGTGTLDDTIKSMVS